jgi:hypothetical protein
MYLQRLYEDFMQYVSLLLSEVHNVRIKCLGGIVIKTFELLSSSSNKTLVVLSTVHQQIICNLILLKIKSTNLNLRLLPKDQLL